MKKDRVLLIGLYFAGFPNADFLTDINWEEFTTIIWRPSILSRELQQHGFHEPVPASMVQLVEGRIELLGNWVSAGHSLIVIMDSVVGISFIDDDRTFRTTERFYPLSAGTFSNIETRTSSGTRMEYCGPRSFAALLGSWVSRLHYEEIIEGHDLIPLMKVSRGRPGDVLPVAGFMKINAGHVYFIPPLAEETAEELQSYCDMLARLPDALSGTPAELPDWAVRFRSAYELKIMQDIARLEGSVAKLAGQISSQQKALDKTEMLKHLFAGTGDIFVNCVANALRELGFKVVSGPHPRADLIAFYRKMIMPIEAKGLDGPAREFNLRQAEKWVADVQATISAAPEDRAADSDLLGYADKLTELGLTDGTADLDCKGMMVIGTYRKTPLHLRTEPDFPDPVARPINRSQVCALTGLQLLGFLIDARENPGRKEAIIHMFESTSGVLSGGLPWSTFLHQN